jgi:unsaturated rhamnogalacturonyl hydrolase
MLAASAHQEFAMLSITTRITLPVTLTLALAPCALAQQTAQQPAKAHTGNHAIVGDQPDNPGPIATDLSPKLKSAGIHAAMEKVADWQLKVATPNFDRDWTYAALYDGLIAASKTTGNPAYRDAVLHFSEQKNWQLLDARFPHADDMAMGKAYMSLYFEDKQPVRMADTKAILDRLVVRPDDTIPGKHGTDLWWWCDALYMAPPVLANMSKATGDPKYDAYMDHEWDITSQRLYSPQYHLFFRDASYLNQKQANSKPVFWSRGNGWVMGGLVKVLEVLPKNDPSRPKYIQQLKEMSAELASIQSPDGLWRTGLLDPDSYDLPEVSGSAFITYGIAYGINEHILDRKTYLPVVEKAWAGMLTYIYADGRLGAIQPIGAAPGQFKASASYVYGVGGFLLAGSELDRLAHHKH